MFSIWLTRILKRKTEPIFSYGDQIYSVSCYLPLEDQSHLLMTQYWFKVVCVSSTMNLGWGPCSRKVPSTRKRSTSGKVMTISREVIPPKQLPRRRDAIASIAGNKSHPVGSLLPHPVTSRCKPSKMLQLVPSLPLTKLNHKKDTFSLMQKSAFCGHVFHVYKILDD